MLEKGQRAENKEKILEMERMVTNIKMSITHLEGKG